MGWKPIRINTVSKPKSADYKSITQAHTNYKLNSLILP